MAIKDFMIVTMPDGSKWSVPTNIIRNNWWGYYRDHHDLKISDFDEAECEDWATNNMNWEDVAEVAVELREEYEPARYSSGWINGEKEFRD